MKKIVLLFGVFLFFSNLATLSADMRFVQVDGALYNPDNKKSVKNFEKLVTDINKQRDVKFVVFTGNNIEKPKEEYLEGFLKAAKKLDAPYYVVLGNKDVNKQKHFGKTEYVKMLKKKVRTHRRINSPNYLFEKDGLVFIVVDGSKEVLPSTMGYYRSDVLDWLNEQLRKNQDKKVIILQHFPLIPPTDKPTYNTFRADEYLNLLAQYDNVQAVFAGHFGVNKEQKFAGILHFATANAPNYRIIDILDYETDNPTFWTVLKR